jgi:hypothetical protein
MRSTGVIEHAGSITVIRTPDGDVNVHEPTEVAWRALGKSTRSATWSW